MKFFASRMLISTVSCALLLASKVSAHSWVWCTDYDVQTPGAELMGPDETDAARRNFDSALCSGWPPNVPTFFDAMDNGNFGVDSGAENRPQFRNEFCIQNSNSYTNTFPMATYASGEIITIVFPAKNHVATDANRFIPDQGVGVYMAPIGTQVQNNGFPSAADFLAEGNLLEDFNGVHANGVADFLGFQNCPDFPTGNPDRATCTMDFQLPANLAAGEYFFGWHWEFNGGEHYSTCWSAQVAGNGGETIATTTDAATTTEAATTTQATQPAETVPGAECSIIGEAACTKGLNPPRGTCVVTDENDDNGFVCVCEDGFENANNAMTCNLEDGIRVQIVLNVQFDSISDEDVFAVALSQDIAAQFDITADRLSFSLSRGTGLDDGLVVAILTVSGASDNNELSAQLFFDELSTADMHEFGAMSNTLSVSCLDCDGGDDNDVEAQDGASSALAPSLALIAAAAVSSLMQ